MTTGKNAANNVIASNVGWNKLNTKPADITVNKFNTNHGIRLRIASRTLYPVAMLPPTPNRRNMSSVASCSAISTKLFDVITPCN